MKPSLTVGVVAGFALAVGGYSLGFYKAKQKMEAFAGHLVSGVSASIRGESLSLLLAAADSMKYPEQQELQRALLRQAKAQAIAVKECASNQACSALAPQPFPQASLVKRALESK